jgi:DNA-binding NarL/FixJ family response regulator
MARQKPTSTRLTPSFLPNSGTVSDQMGAAPTPATRWAPDRSLPIRVVVVDGQAVFRSGLASILSHDSRLEVVAVSEGDPSLADLCVEMSVDVVVTDLRLPHVDGIDLISMIGAASPSTRTLVVASVADGEVVPAMAAGAAGFLLKVVEPEAMVSAVVAVHLGEQVLCREAIDLVLGRAPARQLTRREAEVLEMVAQGIGNKEIAVRLQLGEKTVRNYVSRIYKKLSVHNRVQAAACVPPAASLRTADLGTGDREPRRTTSKPVEVG